MLNHSRYEETCHLENVCGEKCTHLTIFRITDKIPS